MNKQEISTENAPKAIGPYSQGIIAGSFIFASGQIPIDVRTGQFVEGGITEQTHQVFRNIKAVLGEAGASLADVVKTTVFMQELAHFAEMNQVYEQYFQTPFPARSTVQVAGLPKGALVEIEVLAVKKDA